ncbi:Flap endonuclease-1 (rad27/fen1 family) [Giardia duodenalis]|uniref:Flap endonuclease-1 (Rad27/fen1 family) n=1 Tax=Giardia intestinalis TaxID=5741 RepID=V6TN83_GIAIN|nr:Flap endonuclease-1 (rad27/fen1 family) [Giardia intestinalis]
MAFTTEQQTSSTSTLSHESSSRTISILMGSTSCLNNIWTTHQASTCPVSFSDVPIYSSNAFSARQPSHAELQPGDTGFVLSHYAAAVQSDKN